jgi:hypothetical protein
LRGVRAIKLAERDAVEGDARVVCGLLELAARLGGVHLALASAAIALM